MSDKDKNLGDSVQPKPFEKLSLSEKLKLVNISVIPQGDAPDLYGIEESLDLFDLLATVANKVVNKDTFLDFSLLQKAFATYTGAKEIPKELTHLTDFEVATILERVKAVLKFNDPDKASLEILAERIVFAGLLLLSGITDYTRKDV